MGERIRTGRQWSIPGCLFALSGLLWVLSGNVPIGMMNVAVAMMFIAIGVSRGAKPPAAQQKGTHVTREETAECREAGPDSGRTSA